VLRTAGAFLPKYWDPQMYWRPFFRKPTTPATESPPLPAGAATSEPPAAAPAEPAKPADDEDALASFYEMLGPTLVPTADPPRTSDEPPTGAAPAAPAGMAEGPVRYDRGYDASSGRSPSPPPPRREPSTEPPPAYPPPRRAPVVIDEEALIDREKIHCLLCQRAFKSVAILEKHVQQSDLHRVQGVAEVKGRRCGVRC